MTAIISLLGIPWLIYTKIKYRGRKMVGMAKVPSLLWMFVPALFVVLRVAYFYIKKGDSE